MTKSAPTHSLRNLKRDLYKRKLFKVEIIMLHLQKTKPVAKARLMQLTYWKRFQNFANTCRLPRFLKRLYKLLAQTWYRIALSIVQFFANISMILILTFDFEIINRQNFLFKLQWRSASFNMRRFPHLHSYPPIFPYFWLIIHYWSDYQDHHVYN